MIRPIDAYPGKVATPTTEYPDGKAQNITSPGDGTGTPWEAKLVNDLFGFQQFITAKAGITPSGTPDDAVTSQQFDALWKLLNARVLTFNLTVDANYTLTADQNLYGNLTITDTGVVLTAGRDIIVDAVGRFFLFTNSTAQTLTVKTAAGTGIAVAAGSSVVLVCDETNVVNFSDFAGGRREVATAAEIRTGTDNEKVVTPLGINETILGMGQTWQDVTSSRSNNVIYTNSTGKPIMLSYNSTSTGSSNSQMQIYVDGFLSENRNGDSSSGNRSNVTIIVPDGSTYKYNIDVGSVSLLLELR